MGASVPEHSTPAGAGAGGRSDSTELGRRLRRRREQLGLSRQEVAHRAGMSPGYLEYLEERPVGPNREGMFRLAGALDTTAAELRGEQAAVPPGAGWAAPGTELLVLEPAECRAHLAARGVGRVVLTTEQGPAAIPVNYAVDEDAVVFRTAPGTETARAAGAGAAVSFEVDHIDETLSEGWSVLVTGHAVQVTDQAGQRRLAALAASPPWAGGDRPLWIRIGMERLSGRRIRARAGGSAAG